MLKMLMMLKMMTVTILMKGGILCDSVYSMFDEDNSGSMDFAENMTVKQQNFDASFDENYNFLKVILMIIIQAKFAMMMSTPEEKLSWIFEIFDSDGGDNLFSPRKI